jgi:hypothetical protein
LRFRGCQGVGSSAFFKALAFAETNKGSSFRYNK